MEDWKRLDNPITRFRKRLEKQGFWNQTQEDAFKAEIRKELLVAFKKAEELKKPAISNLFTDVFDTMPAHLQEQRDEMLEHIKRHPDFYPTNDHAQ